MPTKQGGFRRIMLVRSAGFPQEWVDEMKYSFPHTKFVMADDNEESIHTGIEGINALIGCPRPLFTSKLLKLAGESLEWVHASGAGIEEFLIPEFVDSDIVFTNGKIIQGPEVSDHAVALLLVLMRNIHYLLTGKGPRPIPRTLNSGKRRHWCLGLAESELFLQKS